MNRGFTPLETVCSKRKSLTGFTLTELLVVMMVLVVVAGVLIPVIRLGIDSWVFAREQKGILAEGTLAMNRMVAEIRQAILIGSMVPTPPCVPYPAWPSCCGWGVPACDSFRLVFIKDYTTRMFRFITFGGRVQRDGRNEVRRSDCGGQIRLRSLTAKYTSSAQFSYFDRNGLTTANCADIHHIRIKLTLTGNDGRDYVFQTTVTPLGLQ